MQPFLLTPYRPVDREAQLRKAALKVGMSPQPHPGVHKKPAERRTLDRIRLKTPWLTVCPCNAHVRDPNYRLYLNKPAKDLLFSGKTDRFAPKDLRGWIDYRNKTLNFSWIACPGWPVIVQPENTASFGHHAITTTLLKCGYLLDRETTYFPLIKTAQALVVDLSVAYTKADAVAREEDNGCRHAAARTSRPGS